MAESLSRIAERFWSKVNKNGPVVHSELGPCWVWTACTFAKGYGEFVLKLPGEKQRVFGAHRVSWMLLTGEMPEKQVLHRCDNPPCVKPDHLFLGTNEDNNADMMRKGRFKPLPGEQNGNAKLTKNKIREIRLAASVGASNASQARLYSVTTTNIRDIVNLKTWRHIT